MDSLPSPLVVPRASPLISTVLSGGSVRTVSIMVTGCGSGLVGGLLGGFLGDLVGFTVGRPDGSCPNPGTQNARLKATTSASFVSDAFTKAIVPPQCVIIAHLECARKNLLMMRRRNHPGRVRRLAKRNQQPEGKLENVRFEI